MCVCVGGGGWGALRMMDGLAAPKIPTLVKMTKSYPPWLCVKGARGNKIRENSKK